MPTNKHFWQGIDVDWHGEILELMVAPHGFIAYHDPRCGRGIKIDASAVYSQLYGKGEPGHYWAMATYDVRGRLTFERDSVRLRPYAITRRTKWITDFETIHEHLEQVRQTNLD